MYFYLLKILACQLNWFQTEIEQYVKAAQSLTFIFAFKSMFDVLYITEVQTCMLVCTKVSNKIVIKSLMEGKKGSTESEKKRYCWRCS